MTKTSRRLFTPEFKLEAANLVVEQNYTVQDASKAMNVGYSTMQRWVRQLRQEHQGIATHPTALTPDQRKIKQLEKRIKQIEMEKDILKKATALLMSDSMNNLR